MVEVAAAISMASAAFNGLKRAMEAGRDAEDMIEYFGKFFDAKDQIAEAGLSSKNASMASKLFSGGSVEAQALEITAAKHKAAQMEKELREYLLYTGQSAFYEDMLRERRNIRQARIMEAKRRAEKRKFILDSILIFCALAASGVIIGGLIAIISSAG